jgi:hypothetical protein
VKDCLSFFYDTAGQREELDKAVATGAIQLPDVAVGGIRRHEAIYGFHVFESLADRFPG